jgi:hypothetical protein
MLPNLVLSKSCCDFVTLSIEKGFGYSQGFPLSPPKRSEQANTSHSSTFMVYSVQVKIVRLELR